METDRLTRPLLFPCADRVKVPQVGSDETKVKRHYSILTQSLPSTRTQDAQSRLHNNYIKKISTDLLFSEAVIRKHAAHTLPYDKGELKRAFDSSAIVKPKPIKKLGDIGRHNQRGTEKKHLPCHIRTVSEHRLKPLQHIKKKIIPDRDDEIVTEVGTVTKDKDIFLTQSALVHDEEDDEALSAVWQQGAKVRPSGAENWDSHLLLNLSKTTARWIVGERTPHGPQKNRLAKLLVETYGESSHQHDTLIGDDASVSEMGAADHDVHSASRNSKQRSGVESPGSDGVKEKKDEGDNDEEDEDDMNARPLASFYRLPGGVRKQQRQLAIDLAGAVNSTAKDIHVFRRKPKPPPSLKDVLNPAIGDKMPDTDNQYEQEWLLGAQLVHQTSPSKLCLDSGNLYQVARQKSFPQDPVTWHKESKKKKKKTSAGGKKKIEMPHQGYKKWNKLPEPLQEELMDIHEAGYDPEAHREPDPLTQKRHKENPSLVQLVDEWRTKWHLGSKWYDSSINELSHDMEDINEHVRLQAIATIARAATFRPPDEPGSVPISGMKSKVTGLFTEVEKDENSQGVLPRKLRKCVEKALFDPSARVCVTAAIALYTLNRPNEEASTILKEVIKSGNGPERWAAAQCLAHAGVCDSFVVGELVKQLFDSENMVKHEQCIRLLTNLSRGSYIVHSMVAEQLNSTSWRHRIISCRILPRLSGTINKDITHKLSNLMWNDWHREVRKIAAQTLGRTGHGKAVHDDLRDRLLKGSERDRIDALQKIGHLGIMTARLLPSYLKCFDDAYIAVRIATTDTAGKLSLKDPDVLKKLLFLTQFDSNWKVKAHALKALGDIGDSNHHVESAVLWALRFEAEAGVRAEACHAMVRLNIRHGDIPTMLQEKLLVEPDEAVREQLAVALESFGVSPTGDMEMVQQIKDEVRRLGTRYNIAAKIALNEEREDLALQHKRFFNSSPAPSELVKSEVYRMKSGSGRSNTRPSTKHSTRTRTPSINISMKDDPPSRGESPDTNLPKTPGSEIATDLMGNRLSPGPQSRQGSAGAKSRPNTGGAGTRQTTGGVVMPNTGAGHRTPAGRCTPEEKLSKLIEVYEGKSTIDEYQEYVRPGETETEGLGKKLEQILEVPVVEGDDVAPAGGEEMTDSRLGETLIDNVDVPMNSDGIVPYPPLCRLKSGPKKGQQQENKDEMDDDDSYEVDDEDGELKSILRPTPDPKLDVQSQPTSEPAGGESRAPSN